MNPNFDQSEDPKMTQPTQAQWADSTRWYDKNPGIYADRADALSMAALQDAFVARIRPGGRVLDYGCGSGRDLLRFLELGFDAHGVDGSTQLVDMCRTRTGSPERLRHMRFENYNDPADSWDGIWAIASLLHMPRAELANHMVQLSSTLRPQGVLFASLKSGDDEFIDERGRPMSTLNIATAENLLKGKLTREFKASISSSVSTDTLGHKQEWTNIEITRR
jgi:cyclopropane fatty-acyl-phospholipid synthase-like methyltransferase